MPRQKRSSNRVENRRSHFRAEASDEADVSTPQLVGMSGLDSGSSSVDEFAGQNSMPFAALVKLVFDSAKVFKSNKVVVGAAGLIGAAAIARLVLPGHRDAVFYPLLILGVAFILIIIKGALTVKDSHLRWVGLPILVSIGAAICCFVVVLFTSFAWGKPDVAAHRIFGDQSHRAQDDSSFNPYEGIELRSIAMLPVHFDDTPMRPVARNIVRAAFTDRVVLHNRFGQQLNDVAAKIKEGKLNEAIVEIAAFIDDATAMNSGKKGDNNDEMVNIHMKRLEAFASNLGEALRPLTTQHILPSTFQFAKIESTYLQLRSEVEDLLTDNNLRPH